MASKITSDDESISDINIVPLVDIILVVLIIFMVTAPAMIKPSVSVQLPSAGSGDQTEPSLLQVAITAEGRVTINNHEASEEEARRIAATEVERNAEVQAVIAADRETAHGTVIRVLDWMKSSGVKRFAVTTDRNMEEK
jgi:biopolymer transport protein ExbD